MTKSQVLAPLSDTMLRIGDRSVQNFAASMARWCHAAAVAREGPLGPSEQRSSSEAMISRMPGDGFAPWAHSTSRREPMDQDLAEGSSDETLDDAQDTDVLHPIPDEEDEDSPELVGGPLPCESQTGGSLGGAGTIIVAEKVRCNA
jgi:hypothetical protein